MSQATIERPAKAAKRATPKGSALAQDPREKIVLRLSGLQAGIAGMVAREDGDTVGRVLEHAGGIVGRALERFAPGGEKAASAAYDEMMDADSFIQAASALAAQDFNVSNRGYKGRTDTADTLAQCSLDVCRDIDRYRMGLPLEGSDALAVGLLTAAEPAEPAEDDAEARRGLALEASWQIETLCVMLRDQARQEDQNTTKLTLSMVVKAACLRIEQLNGQIMTVCSSNCDNEPTAQIAAVINGDG